MPAEDVRMDHRMRRIGPAAIALLLVCTVPALTWAADLPDPVITPGATNPDVTQANIRDTVCTKGWTRTIRPPVGYTNKLKKRQIREYAMAEKDPRAYEEDHLIALSIGGHPTDPRNLWPQARGAVWSAERKDDLEFVLYRMVCSGQIPLADAQQAMATNWIAAYERYVPSHPQFRRHGRFND